MNGDGIYCLRYIDDFIVLAPARKKALAAFKSGLQIINFHGLSAYDPDKDEAKARIGKTADRIDFLGCEILGANIKPNKKSRERLLSKIDSHISESKTLMRNPIQCTKRKRSFVDTLKSINNTLEGWGNQYSLCVSREEPSGLDMAIKSTGRANSVGA